MTITPEESQAYRYCLNCAPEGSLTVGRMMYQVATALRRHVGQEMRLEFEKEHRLDGRRDLVWCFACSYGDMHRVAPPDPRHNNTPADWNRAAGEALRNGGKSDE